MFFLVLHSVSDIELITARQAVFIFMHGCVHGGHVTPHEYLIQFLGSTNWQEVRKSARLQASVDQRQKQLSRPRSICLHSSTLSNGSISWNNQVLKATARSPNLAFNLLTYIFYFLFIFNFKALWIHHKLSIIWCFLQATSKSGLI